MTICDLETGREITGVLERGERGRTYALIRRRLTTQELQEIQNALDALIEGTEINTAGWMPGRDWTGTPYQVIYEKAALYSHSLSGLMFGLLVWDAFERHPENWYSGRYEKDGVEIGSRTYWKPSF